MRTRVLNFYGSGSSTTSAVAQIVVPHTGVITAAVLHAYTGGAAVTAHGYNVWELSLSSSGQTITNDTVGPIASAVLSWTFTTSGGNLMQNSVSVAGVAIPVRENDRIYLHLYLAGTSPTAICKAHVYIAE